MAFRPREMKMTLDARIVRRVGGGRAAAVCTRWPEAPGQLSNRRISPQSCGYGDGPNARSAMKAALRDLTRALDQHDALRRQR